MKLLGYDFVTKESVRISKSKDLVIDDVAVTRKNRLGSLPRFLSIGKSTLNVSCSSLAESGADSNANLGSSATPAYRSSPRKFKPLALRRGSEPGGMNQVQPLVQRTVIVTKDTEGYGLTVSGDNPVFVQTVKEDGAADRAGVRQGDRIMKVNGTAVTGANHIEVVRMISSGSYVALTLLGKSPQDDNLTYYGGCFMESPKFGLGTPPSLTFRTSSSNLNSRELSGGQKSPTSSTSFPLTGADRKVVITGPTPVDEEKQAEWRKKRIQIIGQMLEEEKKHLEELRKEFQKQGETEKILVTMEQAEKRIKNLESQLTDVSTAGEQQVAAAPKVKESQQSGTLGATPSDPSGSLKKSGSKTSVKAADSVSPEPVRGTVTAKARNTISEDASVSASGMHFVNATDVDVVDVISMEENSDEETDVESVAPLDTQGPFSNFADLKSHPAHLSVFLHYLISNGDPASLLFYLITEHYQNGSSKELKKWAYEIHSSFLVPTAPFPVPSIDHDIVNEIDRILSSNASDQEDEMKRLFIPARVIALDDINWRLADFRNKRTLGLGSVFGESLLQDLVPGDKGKELKIADSLLMQHFETIFSGYTDFDQLGNRTQALAASLATVMKLWGLKPACNLHEKLLDKCPLYVTKDKGAKFKIKSIASKRAVQVKGHHFLLSPVFTTTFCYQCSEMIWGVNSQGYFCSNCDVVIHKQCTGSLEDSCYPASLQKGNGAGPAPKRILQGSKPIKKMSAMSLKEEDVGSPPRYGSPPEDSNTILEEPHGISSTHSDDALLHGEELDKTTELPASPMGRELGAKSASADSGYFDSEKAASDIKAIGRSQSMRSREEQIRQSKRQYEQQTNRRAKSDVDVDDKSIAMAISVSGEGVDASVSSSSSSVSRASLPEEEAQRLLAAADVTGDSDVEMETEIQQLEEVIDLEIIRHLKPKEKKRQEVVNELFHTERTHVRKLKILHRLFYTPLLVHQVLPPDFVKLLFANIDDILEIHAGLNAKFKSEKKRLMGSEGSGLYGEIGDVMLEFFDGEEGEKFHKAASVHCQHQQYALEALRSRQKKDTKLQTFLSETESNPLCQKLQLKDMLPAEMQRLTKYPLLLETVGKYTQEDSEESVKIRKCVEQAKSVLNAVNTAKKNSENLRRLEDLQRRLDTTPFDKENHPMSRQYRGMDLRKFKLVHDGQLSWRLGKNKLVDLHVLLLENLLVLLTRHSDGQKLSLKYYDMNMMPDGKWCPVLRLSSLMAKNVATDKKAFFLVSTSMLGPQIYELVAGTATGKKNWFKLITDQVDICKQAETPSKKEPEGTADKLEESNLNDNRLNDSGVSDASQGEEESGSAAGVSSERVQIISQPRLINPSEIEVCQPTVYEHAEPVLTPLERLKRKDLIVLNALTDKQKILAQIFDLGEGSEELNRIADALVEGIQNRQLSRDSKELVLSAIVQANRLLEAINEGMRLRMKPPPGVAEGAAKGSEARKESTEEPKPRPELEKAEGPAVSCFRLTGIAAPLMRSLTALLHSMQQTDEELRRVKEELAHYKRLYHTGSLHQRDEKGVETDDFSDLGSSPSSTGSSYHQSVSGILKEDTSHLTPYVGVVEPASSEETLTDSKVGTPQVKTPDGVVSPVGSARLSPVRVRTTSAEDIGTPVAKSPAAPKSHSGSASPRSPRSKKNSPQTSPALKRHEKTAASPKSPSSRKPQSVGSGKTKTVQNPTTLPVKTDVEEPAEVEQKSSSSPPSDEDERKREKRKQKRQRNTGLTGLNGAELPKTVGADSETGESESSCVERRKKSETNDSVGLEPVIENSDKLDESS